MHRSLCPSQHCWALEDCLDTQTVGIHDTDPEASLPVLRELLKRPFWTPVLNTVWEAKVGFKADAQQSMAFDLYQ